MAEYMGDQDTVIVSKVRKGVKQVEYTPGELLQELYTEALRNPNFRCKVAVGPRREELATFVPGHIWAQGLTTDSPVDGPHPAKVMVIGKMPWKEEIRAGRQIQGEAGRMLLEIFSDLRIRGWGNWYVTSVLKFMPPDYSTRLKSSWIKDCLPLLHQELRIVKPDFILCLGTDASKALLGSKYSVTHMDGRVEKLTFPTAFRGTDSEGLREHTAKVMGVVQPSQVMRDPAARRQLEKGIARFSMLIRGKDLSAGEEDLDHRVVDHSAALLDLLLEVEANEEFSETNVVAVDAEWHGDHPCNAGSYLRTIQFSWLPKCGVGIRITEPGGAEVFRDRDGKVNIQDAVDMLNAFFRGGTYDGHKFRAKRVVGHFFNADLEWLVHYGLDLRKPFSAPLYDLEVVEGSPYLSKGFDIGDVVPAWYRTKFEGGADTGLMCHAIEETASYKLETLAIRYTLAPRYDAPLAEWKVRHCKEQGFQQQQLGGYGDVPDDILLPYGIYDADVTLRLFFQFDSLLDNDYEGNCCREAFWESQIATPSVLEIHQTGVLLDMERVTSLTRSFLDARDDKLSELREVSRWPDFNPRSVFQVREFLFGVRLNGKIDNEGCSVRIGPPEAMRLNLAPLFDTSTPPKDWVDIVARGKQSEHKPSTGKQALAILSQDAGTFVDPETNKTLPVAEYVNLLRDYRCLDQVLKTVLRPPTLDEAGEFMRDENGDLDHRDGLAGFLCDDGRVRTHIYQTKETGRWSSARPNLQNISKSRDNDYKRLLGAGYTHKLRSMFTSAPGTVFVEADYVGAELFGMAIMSGDDRMIEHAQRNQLGESDPNFYDIHSNVAVMSFGLDCPPTKTGLADIDLSHLRIVAKSVVFGIAYGRGAKAIAAAAKEQGIDINRRAAQNIIDTIFSMYPGLQPFFAECQSRATREVHELPGGSKVFHEGWLCNCFGRYRRFPEVHEDERGVLGEFGRQAMNFPIQSMIASVVTRAMGYLYHAREETGNPDLFRIFLQIHDAILLEVPYENVKYVCEEVLPFAMRDCVPIYPSDLEGKIISSEPHFLGIEADVMEHWGESIPEDRAIRLGLPTGIHVSNGNVVNYT
jgi:uracil-DNA glycosylase family 4|tara:strand:- start:3572 stop:6832 length:3261 start_codon:yes stop_codon:yes gene_type:complete